MKRKTIVRLDTETLSNEDVSTILENNKALSHLEENYYMFEFEDTIFTHVLLLLSTKSSSYGYDLTHYLESASSYFRRLNKSCFISIDIGSSDFKRRASEDFGVAMSSLFMVNSYNLKWETIVQIPRNKNISKKTPDFQGYDISDNCYIYESKGSTTPDYIENAISDAIAQVKTYPIDAQKKLAIASYFPNDNKLFPSHSFVVDPPSVPGVELDKEDCIQLHYLNVLKYSGFEKSFSSFEDVFRERLKVNEKKDNVAAYYRPDFTYHKKHDIAYNIFKNELAEKEKNMEFIIKNDCKYIGRKTNIKYDDRKYELFFGVNQETLNNVIIKFDYTIENNNLYNYFENEETSILSDGTIFNVKYIAE